MAGASISWRRTDPGSLFGAIPEEGTDGRTIDATPGSIHWRARAHEARLRAKRSRGRDTGPGHAALASRHEEERRRPLVQESRDPCGAHPAMEGRRHHVADLRARLPEAPSQRRGPGRP